MIPANLHIWAAIAIVSAIAFVLSYHLTKRL